MRAEESLRSRRPRRCADAEEGVTLVAVVIGMAILAILIAAVAPSVGTIMKRDREEELIFRGKQYARAIVLFQRRYGRYPNQLKELYENRPRTIRKLWKDPMCNCDFHPLIQGMPDALPGGAAPGLTPAPGSQLFPPGAPTPGAQPTAPPGSTLGGNFGSSFGPPSGQNITIGPIVGVRSTVHKEGLQQWRGSKNYDEWRFIAGDADRDVVGGLQGGQGSIPGLPQYPSPLPK